MTEQMAALEAGGRGQEWVWKKDVRKRYPEDRKV